MKTIKALLFLLSFGLLVSCYKKDDLSGVEDIPGLGGDTWAQTPIDKWIYDNLTLPYNISVKYKYDQFEFELDKTLVPSREEKIIPVMTAIKQVWIDTYIAEAGKVFLINSPPSFLCCQEAQPGTPMEPLPSEQRKVVVKLCCMKLMS